MGGFLRRPLIDVLYVNDFEELNPTLKELSKSLCQDRLSLRKIDTRYIEELLGSEFVELLPESDSAYRASLDEDSHSK
jgi:hypothetical protein